MPHLILPQIWQSSYIPPQSILARHVTVPNLFLATHLYTPKSLGFVCRTVRECRPSSQRTIRTLPPSLSSSSFLNQDTIGIGFPMAWTFIVQLSPTLYALSWIFSLKIGGKPEQKKLMHKYIKFCNDYNKTLISSETVTGNL